MLLACIDLVNVVSEQTSPISSLSALDSEVDLMVLLPLIVALPRHFSLAAVGRITTSRNSPE